MLKTIRELKPNEKVKDVFLNGMKVVEGEEYVVTKDNIKFHLCEEKQIKVVLVVEEVLCINGLKGGY